MESASGYIFTATVHHCTVLKNGMVLPGEVGILRVV